jgi:hypothetical protein
VVRKFAEGCESDQAADLLVRFDEQAAILEYDAGLPRAEARLWPQPKSRLIYLRFNLCRLHRLKRIRVMAKAPKIEKHHEIS